MACNKCYNPAECRHISNCSSSPLWDAECDTDTEHQLHLLDRYYQRPILQRCDMLSNCRRPKLKQHIYPCQTRRHRTGKRITCYGVCFCMCVYHCIRNKHVNAVSNIDDQTEEVVTSEDERSNGDTSV